MNSQELRKFSSIELVSENRNLPSESFSIQGVSKWIHSLLPRTTGSTGPPFTLTLRTQARRDGSAGKGAKK